jgi:two-component system response regulator YesN
LRRIIMFKTLIVEDNGAFRQSLKRILVARFPSMDIGEAADGKEALQKVDAVEPNLIFVDIKLPGGNGLELTKRIKADHPKITIIILTSYDLPEYREAANQCGANYFLSKDISTEELLKLVQLILSREERASKHPDEDQGN